MRKIISIVILITLLFCTFSVNANADSKLLASGNADWQIADYCVNNLTHSTMIESVLFKDYATVSQQHIMTNNPDKKLCSVILKMPSGDFVDAFSGGDSLEFLCFIAQESASDEIVLNIGDFTAKQKAEKGKINHITVPLKSFTHGNVNLQTVKADFDGNFISVGMTADSGRLDLVFSDIYISDGNHFSGNPDYVDINSQRPDGQLVNFGKRTDFEYFQSGNTVPFTENGELFSPLSSFLCEAQGQKDWTSDITLVKYLSKGALEDYTGITFYINADLSDDMTKILTLRFRSNVEGTLYTFTRDISFTLGETRVISINFTDFLPNVKDKTLTDDILTNVYSFEMEFAKYTGQSENDFSFKYEISDIYLKDENKLYLPTVNSAKVEYSVTEMPTATAENAQIMQAAQHYSTLPGLNPDSYTYTDYQNLKSFLDSYYNLSDEQRTKLDENYGITEQIYTDLLNMYETMDVPKDDTTEIYYTQRVPEQQTQSATENNVSEKTIIYLIIAVSSSALLCNMLIQKYGVKGE